MRTPNDHNEIIERVTTILGWFLKEDDVQVDIREKIHGSWRNITYQGFISSSLEDILNHQYRKAVNRNWSGEGTITVDFSFTSALSTDESDLEEKIREDLESSTIDIKYSDIGFEVDGVRYNEDLTSNEQPLEDADDVGIEDYESI